MTTNDAFKGGVAVITGAGAGIGAGIARAAGKEGMIVIVSDILEDRAKAVADDIKKAGGQAHAVVTDVRDHKSVDALAAFVHEKFGDVRLLVNNAGIGTYGPMWELTPAQWENAIGINVNGIFYGVRAFAPRMVEAGKNGKRAAIVNLSSLGGLTALPLGSPYGVSKHAVFALTECLYLEMQMVNAPVDVSVVVPSLISTRFFDTDKPVTGKYADLMNAHRAARDEIRVTTGMDPDKAGRIIFDQIVAREFWISTDHDLTDVMAKARADFIRNRARPQLPGPMQAILTRLNAGS